MLVVYHSLSGNTKAVADGARPAGAEVRTKEALKAGPEDLFWCDALAVDTPDYHNHMAGGVKDFFDRTFCPPEG